MENNNNTLPTSPDWSTAPDWANWFAIDGDGDGCFFQECPLLDVSPIDENDGMWYNFNHTIWRNTGKYDPSNWKDSLQNRPDNG